MDLTCCRTKILLINIFFIFIFNKKIFVIAESTMADENKIKVTTDNVEVRIYTDSKLNISNTNDIQLENESKLDNSHFMSSNEKLIKENTDVNALDSLPKKQIKSPDAKLSSITPFIFNVTKNQKFTKVISLKDRLDDINIALKTYENEVEQQKQHVRRSLSKTDSFDPLDEDSDGIIELSNGQKVDVLDTLVDQLLLFYNQSFPHGENVSKTTLKNILLPLRSVFGSIIDFIKENHLLCPPQNVQDEYLSNPISLVLLHELVNVYQMQTGSTTPWFDLLSILYPNKQACLQLPEKNRNILILLVTKLADYLEKDRQEQSSYSIPGQLKVNLSIADTMVSTLNVTFNYTYMLNSHWPFGQLYCKIAQFVAILSISASVFTLMAISIDRYMAIMKPLKPRMGRRSTLCIAIAIWIGSIAISCPNLLYFTTYEFALSEDTTRIICYSEWPDGPTNLSFLEYVYNVAFMILTYVLPIASMSYTYARVGLELWGSQSIGECTQRQLENIKSKRRVVKMMIVVVVIFAVCWLPYHLYFILTSYYPEINQSQYIQECYLAIYWLAMSNSMYNPMIYCWMNSRFRRGFKQFFAWCPYVHVAPEALTRREVVTSRYSSSGSPDHHRIIRNGTVRLPMHLCPTNQNSSNIGTSNSNYHHHHHHRHVRHFRSSGIDIKLKKDSAINTKLSSPTAAAVRWHTNGNHTTSVS